MARKKEYIEEEVIEKAMDLFWRNGYKTTSIRMLEKEMGINQFSIYSSFGSKEGVLLESIKCYQGKLKSIVDKLEKSSDDIASIKQYFYDFLEFSRENESGKGCLNANTANEIGKSTDNADNAVMAQIKRFTSNIGSIFTRKLRADSQKDEETVKKQANYLSISLHGLAVASKSFSQAQLDDYIEITFNKI